MWENCHDYHEYEKVSQPGWLYKTKMTPTQQTNGAWITTYSGKQVFPLSPTEEALDIVDIAHHLALLNRFTGATIEPYSVAEHSWRASYLVSPQNALWALLHDAPEAYIADMSRPLKHDTPIGDVYREVEKKLMVVICRKFGLADEEPEEVKLADNRMLMTEKRDLLRNNTSHPDWGIVAEPIAEYIHPVDWRKAKKLFIDRFRELTSGKQTNT